MRSRMLFGMLNVPLPIFAPIPFHFILLTKLYVERRREKGGREHLKHDKQFFLIAYLRTVSTKRVLTAETMKLISPNL